MRSDIGGGELITVTTRFSGGPLDGRDVSYPGLDDEVLQRDAESLVFIGEHSIDRLYEWGGR
jgi:hypothetical protein